VERLPLSLYHSYGCSRTSVRKILSFPHSWAASTDFKKTSWRCCFTHFTSGTTVPKVLHVHHAVLPATGTWFSWRIFCVLPIRWVTGTSYGIIAPLVSGVTSIIDASLMPWDGILYSKSKSNYLVYCAHGNQALNAYGGHKAQRSIQSRKSQIIWCRRTA
jgi:hypothetical protein